MQTMQTMNKAVRCANKNGRQETGNITTKHSEESILRLFFSQLADLIKKKKKRSNVYEA